MSTFSGGVLIFRVDGALMMGLENRQKPFVVSDSTENLFQWCHWPGPQVKTPSYDAKHRLGAVQSCRPALCVSRSKTLDVMSDWLWSRDVSCDCTADWVTGFSQVAAFPEHWSVLLIVLDPPCGSAHFKEDLRLLRQMVPGTAVVLLGSESVRKDIFVNRSSLYDAFVRGPVAPDRVGVILAAAAVKSGHRSYQARVSELRLRRQNCVSVN